jgi:hypothetical protein
MHRGQGVGPIRQREQAQRLSVLEQALSVTPQLVLEGYHFLLLAALTVLLRPRPESRLVVLP